MNKNLVQQENSNKQQTSNHKPDEQSGIKIEGHVKIFDPNTDQVFVNKRA
jgi:hypothetical protein